MDTTTTPAEVTLDQPQQTIFVTRGFTANLERAFEADVSYDNLAGLLRTQPLVMEVLSRAAVEKFASASASALSKPPKDVLSILQRLGMDDIERLLQCIDGAPENQEMEVRKNAIDTYERACVFMACAEAILGPNQPPSYFLYGLLFDWESSINDFLFRRETALHGIGKATTFAEYLGIRIDADSGMPSLEEVARIITRLHKSDDIKLLEQLGIKSADLKNVHKKWHAEQVRITETLQEIRKYTGRRPVYVRK